MAKSSRIQQELAQKRPFRSRTVEAGAAILRTADMIRRHLEAVLEPHGITWQQYNVLRILRGAGAGGLPSSVIGERMIEQTPGVTRLIDRLKAKGLVTRTRGTHDLRQVICRVTPKGLDLLARTERPIDEADDFMLSALSSNQLGVLIELLDDIRGVFTTFSSADVAAAEGDGVSGTRRRA
jgi:MarR family transcriptional regulator, organic hydroperoxide resistance regulator